MLINAKGVKVAVLNDSSNSYNTTTGSVSTMDFSVGGNSTRLDVSHFFEVGFWWGFYAGGTRIRSKSCRMWYLCFGAR